MPHLGLAIVAACALVVVFAITTRMHLTKYNVIVLVIGLALIAMVATNVL